MTRKLNIPVIAITGSAGKTTVKECIAAILKQRWSIIKTHKNNNLPNSTLHYKKKITPTTNAAILEYAMALPKDITRHCNILSPSISVITNIGSAHIGFSNANVEQLAQNKSNIILGMQPDGLLLTNADDDNSKFLLTQYFKGKIIKVSINKPSDYQATNIIMYEKGSRFDVNIRNKRHTFTLNLLGKHNIYNALFAIAVADHLGFTVEEMRKGFEEAYNEHLRFSSRLSVYELANNLTLIDDTKNSNPQASRAAIDTMKQMNKEKYIVVLGDMLQLGAYTEKGHYEVGKYAAENKIDILLAYGKYAHHIVKGATDHGMRPGQVIGFKTRKRLHLYLRAFIKANSVVLVKGSGAMKMGETVNYIRRLFTSR